MFMMMTMMMNTTIVRNPMLTSNRSKQVDWPWYADIKEKDVIKWQTINIVNPQSFELIHFRRTKLSPPNIPPRYLTHTFRDKKRQTKVQHIEN